MTQMIQVPFTSDYQKATIGQNTSLTEEHAILKSQLCVTQISWMMYSIQKESHGNTNKSKQVTSGVTFHHLNTRMSLPLCPGFS